MTQVYTVFGGSGRYDESEEWPIVSYLSKDDAESHLVKARELRDRYKSVAKCIDLYNVIKQPIWNKYDPKFLDRIMHIESLDYYYITTELIWSILKEERL